MCDFLLSCFSDVKAVFVLHMYYYTKNHWSNSFKFWVTKAEPKNVELLKAFEWSCISATVVSSFSLFWSIIIHKKQTKKQKQESMVHVRSQASIWTSPNYHQKNTNCLLTNGERISNQSMPQHAAYRLFIPTPQSAAPARWVTSNQTPSNVKLVNEWRCQESDSLLSSKHPFFSPLTHLHQTIAFLSLSLADSYSTVYFRSPERRWQGSFNHKVQKTSARTHFMIVAKLGLNYATPQCLQ